MQILQFHGHAGAMVLHRRQRVLQMAGCDVRLDVRGSLATAWLSLDLPLRHAA